MTPTQREALDAYERLGSYSAVARELNIHESSVRERIRRAERGKDLDPSVTEAMADAGMQDPGILHSGWIKTEKASLYFQIPKAHDDFAFRAKEILQEITPASPTRAPEFCAADLLTCYPIADAHIGMMAWGKETGEDYDTQIAVDRLKDWIGRAVASSPPSETAVILDVGDLTHADDQKNMTPTSGHVLDVDTRHFRTLEMTLNALVACIDLALGKHKRVIVRILPGNHNIHAYLVILFALAERYREEARVEVQKVPGEFFLLEWGKCLIAAHHGDKAKAERMVLMMADEYPEQWGRTRHRFLFTGHMHHHKSADIGGVTWEQLRAVTAKDAYASSRAYSARAQLQAITYDKTHGEVQRVKVGGM